MNVAFPKPDICGRPSTDSRVNPLDTRQIRTVLGKAMGLRIAVLDVDRVHFPRKRPVQIVYRAHLAGEAEPRTFIGEWVAQDPVSHADNEIRRLSKPRRRQLRPGDDEALIAIPSAGLAVRRPGLDAKLPGLRLLQDKTALADMLARIFGLPATGSTVEAELKAHRLGKRAVISARFQTARGTRRDCFIRLSPVTHDGGRRAWEVHGAIFRALRNCDAVNIAEGLYFNDEFGAAVFTALPGRAPDPSSQDDGQRAGKILTALRMASLPVSGTWTAVDEIGILSAWSPRLALYRPAFSERYAAALEQVASGLYCLPARAARPCHRDYHEGQILLDGRQAGLIDFDTCTAGPAALDAGNYAAHLRLAALRTGASSKSCEAAFLEAAGLESDFSQHEADVWTHAALLRLAAIYALTSEPPTVVDSLIAEATA